MNFYSFALLFFLSFPKRL